MQKSLNSVNHYLYFHASDLSIGHLFQRLDIKFNAVLHAFLVLIEIFVLKAVGTKVVTGTKATEVMAAMARAAMVEAMAREDTAMVEATVAMADTAKTTTDMDKAIGAVMIKAMADMVDMEVSINSDHILL